MARMRLRRRPPAALGDGWVAPRWADDGDGGAGGNVGRRRWTVVGNLDSAWRARVDLAGLVQGGDARWALDWWIGAEDRWHLPSREASVAQVLIGSSPVVETRLRVPSGDAVHRAYAALGPSGEDVVVVEVENATKVPFAVALALRPYGVDALGALPTVALEGPVVRVDGEPVLVLGRSPGRVAGSTGAEGDAATVVLAGGAAPVGPVALDCPDGRASLALVFPLAHTAKLRVVLPAPGTDVRVLDPLVFPSADQVASGWVTHTRRAARLEVPERRLREALAASARHLLLAEPGPEVAAGLDLLGLHDEAARALFADPEALAATGSPGTALHAIARHHALTGDRDLAAASASTVALLAASMARRGDAADRARGHGVLAEAARLLDAAGEPRGAADLRALAARPLEGAAPSGSDARPGARRPADELWAVGDRLRRGDATAMADLASVLDLASPTFAWPTAVPAAPLDAGTGLGHDPAANAALVAALRHLLVDEADGLGPPGLVLSPSVPEAWLGAGWEVHDLPTAHGRLSYAVRWHGDRPALLWELEPRADDLVGDGRPVVLTIPGLDPSWRSTELRGEALLAPVAVPERPARRGVSIPVTIEPMPPKAP
jgi:hypothetical protein